MRHSVAVLLIVLSLSVGSVRADDLYGERDFHALGRLFLTAEQRENLDGRRRAVGPQQDENSEAEPAEPAPVSKKSAAFGLISADGRAPLVWRNGSFRPMSDRSSVTESQDTKAEAEHPDDESGE